MNAILYLQGSKAQSAVANIQSAAGSRTKHTETVHNGSSCTPKEERQSDDHYTR